MPKFPKRTTAGFSLLELIVVIGIFVVLTSTLLFNYNKFGNRLTIDILAHQIAGWVRDAQVSAMSVRLDRVGSGKYPGYGVHFDATPSDAFIYFADVCHPDKQYNPQTGDCAAAFPELEKEIKILQRNRVERICGYLPSNPGGVQGQCPPNHNELLGVDVVFTRPNPDANIIGKYGAASTATTTYASVNISIVSTIEYRRMISMWTTGQISVQ